jgi:hypothetical protein
VPVDTKDVPTLHIDVIVDFVVIVGWARFYRAHQNRRRISARNHQAEAQQELFTCSRTQSNGTPMNADRTLICAVFLYSYQRKSARIMKISVPSPELY